MQVILDLPEPLYRALDVQASAGHTSLETLLVQGARYVLGQNNIATIAPEQFDAKLPVLKETGVGPLLRMGANMNEYMFTTEDEWAQIERDSA